MYKDKDRQREADRVRQQRRRDAVKAKGVTMEGVTQGVTKDKGMTAWPNDVIPILDRWLEGGGTEYQRRLGVLGVHYTHKATA